MEKVYIETSIPSYLVQKNNRDIIIAGNQASTWEWWTKEAANFELCISQVVLDEAAEGDPYFANQRLELISSLTFLETTPEAIAFARVLETRLNFMMPKAKIDILHMAIATVTGMDYLLTWNCKHIANAHVMKMVHRISQEKNYQPVMIVTPPGLMIESGEEVFPDVP